MIRHEPVSSITDHFTESNTDPELDNLRIKVINAVVFPQLLVDEIPMTSAAKKTVLQARQNIRSIIKGEDDRLLVIIGPCSIHDPLAALDYARKLRAEAAIHSENLVIVMRVYFEKPRTTIGWKGLINDPLLDDTCEINLGLRTARELLVHINDLGMPCATEMLDTLTPQYICDTLSWVAIGARTTESQLHRELASGLSMPVGFKNNTSGNIKVAAESCMAAQQRHRFLSVTKHGIIAVVETKGNPECHVVLRGGSAGPNFTADFVRKTVDIALNLGTCPAVVLDCSHGNSEKDYRKQSLVCTRVAEQISGSELYDPQKHLCSFISGVMIESNIKAGRQNYIPGISNKADLSYGMSITDGCMDWEETCIRLQKFSKAVKMRRHVQGQNENILTPATSV